MPTCYRFFHGPHFVWGRCWDRTGRRQPIAAFGNSDGDLVMLQYTTIGNPKPSCGLIMHHTDAEREYAYDAHPTRSGKLVEASVGQEERGLRNRADSVATARSSRSAVSGQITTAQAGSGTPSKLKAAQSVRFTAVGCQVPSMAASLGQ
jgi:hypothetical protein